MIPKAIAIKVDVDTRMGMRRGVPVLLDLFAKHGVKATFFLSFGPDRSGTAIWQVFKQKGFLKKMLRTNALKMYGWRTILSGTILPAKPIAADCPDLVKRIEREGHEVGIHCWDHRLWQDKLNDLSEEKVREQVSNAHKSYREILGRAARSMAAPAWHMNRLAFQIEDELGLLYASDSRGPEPFLPVIEGRPFRTPQFPTTIPCIEELIASGQMQDIVIVGRLLPNGGCAEGSKKAVGIERFPQLFRSLREDGLNVFPAHAEVEGTLYAGEMGEFIDLAKLHGYRFCRLDEIASAWKSLPAREVQHIALPGRASLVTAAASA